MKIKPLDYKHLRKSLRPAQLPFQTTEKLKSSAAFIGQERALAALRFGISIQKTGYNLYAMGPSGIGKRSLIQMVLTAATNKSPIPPDWCYIHNFDTPEKPIALSLPAGRGTLFQQDMKVFIEELLENCMIVFESDEYRAGMKEINDFFNQKRKKYSKKTKRKKQTSIQVGKIPYLYKERHTQEKKLQLKLLTGVIEPLVQKYQQKYAVFPLIVHYLTAIQKDSIDHVDDFIKQDEKTTLLTFSLENPALVKYKVNVVVDNSQLTGAPIIFADNAYYANLICRIEHTSEQGALATNFTLIRAGALMQANGGYLIIEARKFKDNRESWETLKSVLYAKKIKIEPMQQAANAVNPISLEPMPIPLDIKIILMGDRNTYYAFCQKDPDFIELFKVPVDFDEQINRTQKNINSYARLIGSIAKRENLRTFHASAVAAIIDYSTRFAEDIMKLTTHIRDIEDLVIEADYWAGRMNKKIVTAAEVNRAINAQVYRMDRARELYYEDIQRRFIIIKTKGAVVGQVNCLSVRKVGSFSYGHPTRVTARVRLGKGHVMDIQREIKMAGPLHSKAGLIISSFLAGRFNPNQLFALSASIAFEQLYCWTDGDSASVGELCALLSALANMPLLQSLAITGSIDQYGNVQAIGGVNEKIEGFFDVCKEKGFTGKQGVIIPAVNKNNLMLREDIVAAVKAKKFFIYPINTIDEAIYLLTNEIVGASGKDGHYPKNTLYYKIENRLQLFAKNKKG